MRSIHQFYTRNEAGEIVPNAEVKVNFAGGSEAPIFTSESGGTEVTQPLTATASGKAVFYIEPGIYDIETKDPITLSTATFSSVEISLSKGDSFADYSKTIKVALTTDLINMSFDTAPVIGTITESLGYSSKGGGGAAQWQSTGVTGQTPSQSPAQLGYALLNDASGNQWALIIPTKLHVRQVGAVGDGVTNDTAAIQAAFNAMDNATVYDQQFYGGVVSLTRGSYNFNSTLDWGRFSIEGDGSFNSVLLWSGGSGVTAITKTQANTYMKGVSLQVVNAGLLTSDFPNCWIDSSSTKVDWSYHLYDVYFGKCGGASLRVGEIVNAYFERVRFNNAECLLEVNGSGGGSANRVVSLKNCTVDFTQLTGANVDVDCLFRFNLGNSDYCSLIIENWRFEGDNDNYSGTEIIQLNDAESPTQELRSRPLSVEFKNVGFSFNVPITKSVDLIGVNSSSLGVNVPVTFNNFYQTGNITNLFTAGSLASLSGLQENPELPLTLGSWSLWPAVGGDSDKPIKFSEKINFNTVDLVCDGDNISAPSVLSGDPSGEATIKTLSGGIIDVTGKTGLITVDTEASAATDDLNTITGGVGNQKIMLRTSNNSRDVVVKDGAGNIIMGNTGADVTLDTRTRVVTLIYSSQIATWLECS